jgi:hypothetical protein
MFFHSQSSVGLGHAYVTSPQIEKVTLRVNPDGSLVPLEPAAWFVCFVPPIDKQFWHRFVHKVHAHVFALRPEREEEWTVFEPWWTRLLVATITTEQAVKFLLWGAKGDVLMVREAIPGHSSQLRGMMTCAALAAHMLGRTYWVWTPHQLYRRLLREPNVCQVDVSALLKADLNHLARANSRSWCDHNRPQGAAKPFCMKCGRDLPAGVAATSPNRSGDSGALTSRFPK